MDVIHTHTSATTTTTTTGIYVFVYAREPPREATSQPRARVVMSASRRAAFAVAALAVIAVIASRTAVDAAEVVAAHARIETHALRYPLLAALRDHALRIERAFDDACTRVWTEVLANFSPFVIAGPLTFVYHELVYFGAWTPWLLMDRFDVFKRWKIQPEKTASAEMVGKCLKKLLKSHVCIQLPMQLMFHYVAPYFGFSLALPLPKSRELLWQIPTFFIIEDFYFYWIHRALHHKSVYKYVHKIHHEHTHPFGIAAEYAHPAETFLLGIGTLLGPLFYAKHMVTLWIWLFFRLLETVEDHSGYDVPWNPTNLIPFWGGAVHHDFHHKTFAGPYSSVFTWCDWMFGTDKLFRAQQAKLRGGKESIAYPAVFRGAPNERALRPRAAKKVD
jgi:sterol desaturase/sphingolipid hydroxylase (fatty acid hydroxylase superfamily)